MFLESILLDLRLLVLVTTVGELLLDLVEEVNQLHSMLMEIRSLLVLDHTHFSREEGLV